MKKELSVYVHIPFCGRKCLYCDFLSFCPGEHEIEGYFQALEREIKSLCEEYRDFSVRTVFFGGGTPSFPEERYVCRILEVLRECFEVSEDAEISIEVNPASAISDKLRAYKKAGFNRLSVGVQSFDDGELRSIGRLHDSGSAVSTFRAARDAGFKNINIDLMSALPGQSASSYLSSLERVKELSPEHISAYSLIIEEGTPFYDMDLELPDEDTDRQMYHDTKRILSELGYSRYEISNYARPGFECRHNKVYWQRGNYLGLGLGAASMVENTRWINTRDINRYLELVTIRENTEHLSIEAQMEEFMFLGLRLTEGISLSEFKRQFGKPINEVYGEVINKYESMGLLTKSIERSPFGEEQYLRLTDQGLDVSNTVMADFLLS